MAGKSDYKFVEVIISSLKEVDTNISYEQFSQKNKIKLNSLKKWLKIINLIKTSSLDISLTKDEILINKDSSKGLEDMNSIHSRIRKRKEDPNIQEFLTEFKSVLSKTKTSLEDGSSKKYSHLSSKSKFSTKLSPEYSDLQAELSQVLEQGVSYLTSPENVIRKNESKSEDNFLLELKQAVNLGIDNLEKVLVSDYKEKKGRVSAMKSELEEVFKNRKTRQK